VGGKEKKGSVRNMERDRIRGQGKRTEGERSRGDEKVHTYTYIHT